MTAVCFRCGKTKRNPLESCQGCNAKPLEKQDKIISMALSSDCIGQKRLSWASRYIIKRKQVPQITDQLMARATRVLELSFTCDQGDSSMEFSSAFFDVSDLQTEEKQEDGPVRSITVYAIGKPPGDAPQGLLFSGPTYHEEKWLIGGQISQAEYDELAAKGIDCLYVTYRFIGGKWSHRRVTFREFEQLRAIEEGRLK